jgi:hypothetical protein
MTWNSASPSGSLSVRANRTPMNQNTTYIETTMGNTVSDIAYATSQKDHFWAPAGADFVGHHRWVKMPAFTVGGTPSDPGSPLGTSMDGMMYLRLDSADSARVQGFYRNVEGIYQFIPAYKAGTSGVITGSYTDVTSVPANVYGEIFMTSVGAAAGDEPETLQIGYFYSTATVVRAWALTMGVDGSDSQLNLKFANSSTEATNLNIRARANDAANNLTWAYKITWRTL